MTVFIDTSAAVKLYADEPLSDAVRRLSTMVASSLVRVELAAALWRKERIGELERPIVVDALRDFDARYLPPTAREVVLLLVPVRGAVVRRAAELTGGHGLRAYDAVQLASALVARDAAPTVRTFACFDDHLRRAAAAESLEVWPAQL